MSRLDNVIDEVKNARLSENRPWIYDDNGNIKEDVFVFDMLKLLEALKEDDVEFYVEDEEIENAYDNYDTADNTYNHGCNISNDLNYHILGNIAYISVHLYGDIRGGYSETFAIDMGDYNSLIEFLYSEFEEDIYQIKDIKETNYSVTMNMFYEGIDVYDYENQKDFEQIYEIEAEDIIKEINTME